MKLDAKDFKRFKELSAKAKAGKLSPAEKAELDELSAKRNTKGSNDISWWNRYPDLVKDVTNFPFNWIPGTKLTTINFSLNQTPLDLGVIAIAELAPAIGISASDADAFNAQIRQLWLDMHRKYRGIGSYQKSDLGMALIAINSLFETIAKFERIYGVINTYHIGNRVVPNGLKDALGISDDLERNLADFRYTINLAISKVKQLCLPKGLSVLQSDIVTISNLYKDAKDRRAFIFGYDVTEFGSFTGTLTNTGGAALGSAVIFEDFDANYMNGTTPSGFNAFNVSDIQDVLERMIGALLNDDDVQLMCSDLLAAYGPDNVMTLLPLPENYVVEPVEDYERSLQFHNLGIVGKTATVFDNASVDLTMARALASAHQRHVFIQDNNVILYRLGTMGSVSSPDYTTSGSLNVPVMYNSSDPEYTQSGKVAETLFDTWAETPGDVEVMCGTRYLSLSGTTTTVGTGYSYRPVVTCGTKVAEVIRVWRYRGANDDYARETIYGNIIEDSTFNSNKEVFIHLMQMDWAPIFYINDSGDFTLFGDIDNFTKISASNLSRLHEVALLSGYSIPMVSRE